MRANKIFLLALITITCTSMMCECDDKTTYEPQLPPETTTGANTFGCLVNGKVWLNGGVGFPNYSLAISQLSENWLIIIAKNNYGDTISGFGINIKINPIIEKKYSLDTANCFIYFSKISNNNGGTCIWSKEESSFIDAIGFIELTRFDLSNGIVSGRFEVTLYRTECDSIVITQGRFDLKK
jgi:hypothetical protein